MIASILLLKRMKSSQTVSKKANFLKRVNQQIRYLLNVLIFASGNVAYYIQRYFLLDILFLHRCVHFCSSFGQCPRLVDDQLCVNAGNHWGVNVSNFSI